MTRPRSRRDFLLDSGAVTALASETSLLDAYLKIIADRFEGAILVPTPVLAEVRTGYPRIDVLTDRLLKAIGGAEAHLEPVADIWNRAGVLRTQALPASKHDISTTDAVIVALAEERSFRAAVTIVTSDPGDIRLLVDLAGRTNIAVDGL